MSLNKNNIFIFLLIFLSLKSFTQQKKVADSTKVETLDEVVVTGQLRPQSIKQSVFEVKVITKKDIENRAGNNLADLLSQILNIDVFQNASNGKSDINVLGLDGKYFKVLIDNIPVINEEGFGNSTDLTLINLDDVERIELVQGAMGVQYGANTLSGVLNIITKKKTKNSWEIKTFLQEETVGKEYEFFNQGRHIQSVNIGHQFTDEIYLNTSYNRNDFRGYLGDLKGQYYDVDNQLRGHRWLPKRQNFAKLLLSHKGKKIATFYKFDYLYEDIFRYDSIVRTNFIPQTLTSNPSSLDERFNNQRFVHHLNVTGHIGILPFNISVSYQKQEKSRESYTYFIREDRKDNINEGTFLSKDVWFSRGTFSNIINTNKVVMQGGFEVTNENGFGSPFGVTLASGQSGVSNTLTNVDLFTSAEIDFAKNFSLKPGLRASFTNLFDNQFYYSLSARQLFKNNWEARTVLGYGTRTPNFDELYTYFVDVNHDVRGNENLNPEEGLSAFLHIKKQSNLSDDFSMNNKLTLSYIAVRDRIELITINQAPLQFQYNNIDEFSSLGIAVENDFYYNNFKLNLGVSFFTNRRIIDYNIRQKSNNQNNFQLNTNFSYTIPNWDTSITAYFKHIGKTNRFVQVGGVFENQNISPYSWMDATINKSFSNKKVVATIGVRNLFDVTEINTSDVNGAAHNGTNNSLILGYGRSYFIKLAYNINI